MFSSHDDKAEVNTEAPKSPVSQINQELIEIRERRLKWIINEAKVVVEHFHQVNLRKQLSELLLQLEECLRAVIDTPDTHNQLYAPSQAEGRWKQGEKIFSQNKIHVTKLLQTTKDSKQPDEGDYKATNLILEDIEKCYQSGLEPTWTERKHQKLWDKFIACLEKITVNSSSSSSSSCSGSSVDGPSCFISYAWGVPTHEKQVHTLAQLLKNVGVNVYLDIWHNRYGSIIKFTEKVTQADYVVVVGTPKLRSKWLSDEPHAIQLELDQVNYIVKQKTPKKLIKLLLDGKNDTSFPDTLVPSACHEVDFSHQKNYFEKFFNLIEKIFENHAMLLSKVKQIRAEFIKNDRDIKNEYQCIEKKSEGLKNYYREKKYIERLLYPRHPLSLEGNYIHLTIVNESERHEEKVIQAAGRRLSAQSEHGKIATQEDPQIYEELYNPPNPKPVSTIIDPYGAPKPFHILITGLAGIGKTTLSQYLCYMWAKQPALQPIKEEKGEEQLSSDELKELEKFKHWHDRFSLAIRIPLRNLMSHKYKDNNRLTTFDFLVEHLSPGEKSSGLVELSPQENERLKDQIRAEEQSGHLLLILDGYDEVARDISISMKEILKALLAARHVIITSRPYYLDDLAREYGFTFDKAYRVTGFTDDNINHYITNFFKKLPQPKPDTANILKDYLKKNLSLWGPCHIPINLELICSTWEQHPFKQYTMTMTELYEKVVLSLCKRYLHKKGEDITVSRDKHIWESCEKELNFLEHLAFTSIIQRKMVTTITESLDYIENQYSSSSDKRKAKSESDQFVKNILEAGLFKSIGDGISEAEKEYYFPHRIFQEYFAARYFAKNLDEALLPCIKDMDNISPPSFIQNNRYNVSLEIMWWFVAGKLYLEKSKLLKEFFNHLLATSGDIIGNYDFMLLVRCWDEAHASEELLNEGRRLVLINGLQLLLHGLELKYLQPLIERLSLSTFVCNARLMMDFFIDNISNNESAIAAMVRFVTKTDIIPTEGVLNILFDRAKNFPILTCYLAMLLSRGIYADLVWQGKLTALINSYLPLQRQQFIEVLESSIVKGHSISTFMKWLETDNTVLQEIALVIIKNLNNQTPRDVLLPSMKALLSNNQTTIKIKLTALTILDNLLSNTDHSEHNNISDHELKKIIEESLSVIETQLPELTDIDLIKYYSLLDKETLFNQSEDIIKLLLKNNIKDQNRMQINKLLLIFEKRNDGLRLLDNYFNDPEIKSMSQCFLSQLPTDIQNSIIIRLLDYKTDIEFLVGLLLISLYRKFPSVDGGLSFKNNQDWRMLLKFIASPNPVLQIVTLNLTALALDKSPETERRFFCQEIIKNFGNRIIYSQEKVLQIIMMEEFFQFVPEFELHQLIKVLHKYWKRGSQEQKLLALPVLLKLVNSENQKEYIDDILFLLTKENDALLQIFSAFCLVLLVKTPDKKIDLEKQTEIVMSGNNSNGKCAWYQALSFMDPSLLRTYSTNNKIDFSSLSKVSPLFGNQDNGENYFKYFPLLKDTVAFQADKAKKISMTHDKQTTFLLDGSLQSEATKVQNALESIAKNGNSDIAKHYIPSLLGILHSDGISITYRKYNQCIRLTANTVIQLCNDYLLLPSISNFIGYEDLLFILFFINYHFTNLCMRHSINNTLEPKEVSKEFFDLFRGHRMAILSYPKSLRWVYGDRFDLCKKLESDEIIENELNTMSCIVLEALEGGEISKTSLLTLQIFLAEIIMHNRRTISYRLKTLERLNKCFNAIDNLKHYLRAVWTIYSSKDLVPTFSGALLNLKRIKQLGLSHQILVANDNYQFSFYLTLSQLSNQDLTDKLACIDTSYIKHPAYLGYILQKVPLIHIIEHYLQSKNSMFIPVIVVRIIQENRAVLFKDDYLYLRGKNQEKTSTTLTAIEQSSLIAELRKVFSEIYHVKSPMVTNGASSSRIEPLAHQNDVHLLPDVEKETSVAATVPSVLTHRARGYLESAPSSGKDEAYPQPPIHIIPSSTSIVSSSSTSTTVTLFKNKEKSSATLQNPISLSEQSRLPYVNNRCGFFSNRPKLVTALTYTGIGITMMAMGYHIISKYK